MQAQHNVQRISEQIARYLSEHPQAADTIDGICSWWLPNASVEPQVVRAVIDALVLRGFLQKKQLPDGTIIYCRGAAENKR